ncbi:hypothetical protein ACSLPA_33415, partial [Escherichia coli]
HAQAAPSSHEILAFPRVYPRPSQPRLATGKHSPGHEHSGGNALLKEQAILEKEMTGLKKARPVASLLSEIPLMTWAEPEYRK